MELKKYRWSKTYEAGESELLTLFAEKNIAADRWEADMSEVFEPHVHAKDKKLWCSEGSITFTINNKSIALQAGDALDLPAYSMHSAVAGFMGCVCFEFPKINDNPALAE